MQISMQGASLQELRGSFGNVWIRLTNLCELGFSVEKQDAITSLQNITAKSGRLDIKLPIENGELTYAEPLLLEGLSADLQLTEGKPFTGAAKLALLRAPQLSLRMGEANVTLSVEATQVLFEKLPVGDTVLYLHTLSLQKIAATQKTLSANIESLELKALRVTLSEGSFQISLPEAQLAQLSFRDRETLVQVASLLLSEQISISKQSISIGQISTDAVSTSVGFSSAPSEKKEKRPAPQIDLRILDGIEGKLDADIDVKVKVPVIGHRHAVHKIRLPIEGGAINFVELKNNLAFLESSLIGFVVEGSELILQRDIPLIPDKPKPIIYWALDADGQRLAAQEKVPLRALPNARLADSDEPKEEKKASPLEHLKVKGLSIEATIFSQEAFTLDGVISKLSLEKLTVQGDLSHVPGQPPVQSKIQIGVKNLLLSLFRFPVGERALDVRAVTLSALSPCVLSMNGLTPASLQATLSGLTLRGVSL